MKNDGAMKDLFKVNILQLYLFWKNLSIAMVLLMVLLAISTFMAPIFSLGVAFVVAIVIYARIYANKTSHHPTYMLVGYALMVSVLIYTFVCLALVLIHIWTPLVFKDEFLLLNRPFLPILMLAPVCFCTLSYCYLNRGRLHRRLDRMFGVETDYFLKGKLGAILTHESARQMRILILLFGVLTIINWCYYGWFFYNDTVTNGRDIYIFFWLNIVGITIFLIYLLIHHYELSHELKDSGRLITPEEVSRLGVKTYIRYYVICGDYIYLSPDIPSNEYPTQSMVDTPVFNERSGVTFSDEEVAETVKSLIGKPGELKFFCAFSIPGLNNQIVARYFYFLDGKPEDYPALDVPGQWYAVAELQKIHKNRPHGLSSYLVADCLRLLTILNTEKNYDERGNRRFKIKSYMASLSLVDIRRSDIDFQSDKWIDISRFNADMPFFRLRRFFRSFRQSSTKMSGIMP